MRLAQAGSALGAASRRARLRLASRGVTALAAALSACGQGSASATGRLETRVDNLAAASPSGARLRAALRAAQRALHAVVAAQRAPALFGCDFGSVAWSLEQAAVHVALAQSGVSPAHNVSAARAWDAALAQRLRSCAA